MVVGGGAKTARGGGLCARLGGDWPSPPEEGTNSSGRTWENDGRGLLESGAVGGAVGGKVEEVVSALPGRRRDILVVPPCVATDSPIIGEFGVSEGDDVGEGTRIASGQGLRV